MPVPGSTQTRHRPLGPRRSAVGALAGQIDDERVEVVLDIAVHGAAAQDASFTDACDRIRYSIPVQGSGPFAVEAELRYQPISFRWADNLRGYDAAEPRRFVSYYDAMASSSSTVLVKAVATAR